MGAEYSGPEDASTSGFAPDLRSELRKLDEHLLAVLEMIRTGESPKPTARAEVRLATASDPELRGVELAVQSVIEAISTYLCK